VALGDSGIESGRPVFKSTIRNIRVRSPQKTFLPQLIGHTRTNHRSALHGTAGIVVLSKRKARRIAPCRAYNPVIAACNVGGIM